MRKEKDYHLYISSCHENGGIYHCSFNTREGIKVIDKTALDRPMYTVIYKDRLYVLLRAPFGNSEESGIIYFDIAEDGHLYNKSEMISTRGRVGCHLCVDNDHIYAVNYISGSVVLLRDKLVQHSGQSINPFRQEGPHTHFVSVTPDDEYVCVTDLGTDKIITYDKNLNFVEETEVKQGNGPRHLAFSEDGRFVFCVNELSSSITLYMYQKGRFTYIDENSTLPKDFCGENTAAAIRCVGKDVYVSNRGHNSIAQFEFAENKLSLQSIFSCHGKSPRDFEIIDKKVICTNESDNSVTVLDALDGTLKQKIEIEKALCVSYQSI